jgi:hypothetical protein
MEMEFADPKITMTSSSQDAATRFVQTSTGPFYQYWNGTYSTQDDVSLSSWFSRFTEDTYSIGFKPAGGTSGSWANKLTVYEDSTVVSTDVRTTGNIEMNGTLTGATNILPAVDTVASASVTTLTVTSMNQTFVVTGGTTIGTLTISNPIQGGNYHTLLR